MFYQAEGLGYKSLGQRPRDIEERNRQAESLRYRQTSP